MRALEKDRTRRYGSASNLAADVRRHLDHQPVLASPPSTLYRVRKFVRRHRFGVAAAAALVVLLIAFAATMENHQDTLESYAGFKISVDDALTEAPMART